MVKKAVRDREWPSWSRASGSAEKRRGRRRTYLVATLRSFCVSLPTEAMKLLQNALCVEPWKGRSLKA